MFTIDIIEAKPEHSPFIYNTFIQCMKYSPDNEYSDDEYETYKRYAHQVLKGLMETNKCLVAVSRDNPNEYFGYILFSGSTLNFIYVKAWRDRAQTERIRRHGIGSELFRASGLDPSNFTAGLRTNTSDSLKGKWSATFVNNINFKYVGE